MTPPFRDVTIGRLLTRLAGSLPDHDALIYAGPVGSGSENGRSVNS